MADSLMADYSDLYFVRVIFKGEDEEHVLRFTTCETAWEYFLTFRRDPAVTIISLPGRGSWPLTRVCT